MTKRIERRVFLGTALAASAGISTVGGHVWAKVEAVPAAEGDSSALENLMREHGVLNRVLLIYEEGQRRIRAKSDFQPKFINQAATVVKNFIESYHEVLEEQYVFPRLVQAGKYKDLCRTLMDQHMSGRELTSEIMTLTSSAPKSDSLPKLDAALGAFARMYRPHEAFEDTVVFTAFRQLIPRQEYAALGATFEKKERQILGAAGFTASLAQIEQIETALGIHDIGQFTAREKS